MIALSGLSPRIQAAIIEGTQPVDMTLKRLLATTLPLDWTAQEQALAFEVRPPALIERKASLLGRDKFPVRLK
ncbi:MAG: hypothetical protein CML66_27070 [Rhodobacteraceae bacterium]|nr:hypothetical protein [Paracoccaceae bacterium]MAY46104.1 hypothetical protein [Paracoccaceae bacterium]